MTDLSLKQRIGLELARRLRHNTIQLHPLRTLFWECTLRCNMNCRHCGSDCRVSAATPDMPAKDFLKAIDDITPHVETNHVFIVFTGGEALLRRDLEEVGRELYLREFPWGVVTNGYLLSEKRLDSLIQAGMHSLTVSLDGFEEQHNWMRQNEHSFEKVEHAIRLLAQERDIVWDVVTCVNPRNYGQLEQFKQYLYSIGVRRWRVFTVFPMGRAATDLDMQLSDEQFRGVLDFIQRSRTEGKMQISYACEGFLGHYEVKVRNNYFYCRAGVDVASVLADGSISGCPSIRSNFHQGNIYRDNLWDVWQSGFLKFRNKEWAHRGICKDCKMWRYCEGSGMHLRDEHEDLLFCHYHRLHEE